VSIENPQTLEEWKQFRFPTRDRSTLDEVRREMALANGEIIEKDDEEDGGEGKSGGGEAGPAMLMGLTGYGPGERPELPATAPEVNAPATAPPPAGPPPRQGEPSEPPSASDEPPVASDATGDSWSYDAARGLLINWRIGRTLILAKMDKVGKLVEYAKLVERGKIDRPGFEASLDLACQDIHKQSLATILKNWDPKSALAWGEMPDPAILPTTRPRRRVLNH
jgi:hypothetical protein